MKLLIRNGKVVRTNSGNAIAVEEPRPPIQEQINALEKQIKKNYIPNSQKGVAGGVATLDDAGKVPASQLPSYNNELFVIRCGLNGTEVEFFDHTFADINDARYDGKVPIVFVYYQEDDYHKPTPFYFQYDGDDYLEFTKTSADGQIETITLYASSNGASYSSCTNGSANNLFVVTFTGNTADKTFAEIRQAVADGKVVIGRDDSKENVYQLFYEQSDGIDFGRFEVHDDHTYMEMLYISSNGVVGRVEQRLSSGGADVTDYSKVYATAVDSIEYDGDSIYWDSTLEFTDENDNFVKEKPMVVGLPLIAGNGIEFSATDDAQRIIIHSKAGASAGGGQKRVTYAELKSLRDNSQLVAGTQYRITDYVTTTSQNDTQSAGHQFDLIVTALSANTLSENASADYHLSGGIPVFDTAVLADGDGNLIEGTVIPYYYIFQDFPESADGTNEDYKSSDQFFWYDYLENNEGAVVPVLYKTDIDGRINSPEEFDYADTQDIFYYDGTQEIDGTTYDRWRKVNHGENSSHDWGSEGKIWALTNRVVVMGGDSDARDPYFANANLPAWEIKYCLDNDTSRFIWADEENGKGVIYYMKDEYNNECPYDFKNIQFIRKLDDDGNLDLENGTDTWCYTFGGNQWDRSIPQEGFKIFNHNSICPHYTGCNMAFALPNNVFLGNSECMTKNNRLAWLCSDNTFGTECQNNTLGFNSGNNIFGNYCKNNILGNECRENQFGDGCQKVTFEADCSRNILPINTSNSRYEKAVSFITLVCDNAGGDVRYITIANGVSGDWSKQKTISVTSNADYEQIFRKSGTQEILVD